MQAYDLYEDNYSNEIIFTENYIPGEEYLDDNLNYITGAQAAKLLLLDLGVKEEDITFLKDKSANTFDEVVNITNYIKNKDYKKVILVTSPYHSRRTTLMFNKSIKKNSLKIETISSPTKYEEFDKTRWYKNRENFNDVISETLKLINFFINEQFKL